MSKNKRGSVTKGITIKIITRMPFAVRKSEWNIVLCVCVVIQVLPHLGSTSNKKMTI